MTTTAAPTSTVTWWWFAIVSGLVLGVSIAVAVDLAVGAVVVLGALVALANSSHRTERLVGLYWIAFGVYSIVFYGLIVRFGFYPFYAAFAVSIVVALMRGGLRIDLPTAWLYAGFMVTALWSFVGFADAVDSSVIQRLLAYLVGALVYLQFRSREGLRQVALAAIVTSLVIAAFVIVSSVEGGFRYRGDIEANPNTVARVIGYGVLVTIGLMMGRERGHGGTLRSVIGVATLGTMLYGLVLLASRGSVISLGFAVTIMLARAVTRDWRSITILVVIAALGGVAMLLPGGSGLVERFTTSPENVSTAGSRIPLWEVTIESLRAGNVVQLVFGHGFDSSKPVVERRFLGQTSIHNTYLHFMYEFGVVSLLLHVALLVYLFVRGWQITDRNGFVMLGLLSFLAIESVSGDIASLFDYWIVLGYIAAIGHWAARSPQVATAAHPSTSS